MQRNMASIAVSLAVSLAAASFLAGPAEAQVVDSKAARKLLFSERGTSVQVSPLPGWPEAASKLLESQVKQFSYYAAIAVPPGDPADQAVAMTAAGHHSAAAAQAAALAGCNAQKKSAAPCVVVATVLPRGYRAQGLGLSVEATKSFKSDYRKLKAPKAFAISAQSGAFGFARGDGSRALAACAAKAEPKGARDCRIVVQDQ